jgi:hypothetical protein
MREPLRSFGLDQLEASGELATAEIGLRWAVEFTAWVDSTLHS